MELGQQKYYPYFIQLSITFLRHFWVDIKKAILLEEFICLVRQPKSAL